MSTLSSVRDFARAEASSLTFSRAMSLLTGVVAVGVFTFVLSYVAWQVIHMTVGIRVGAEEEIEGLDIGEHGNSAYPEFVTRKPAMSHFVALAQASAKPATSRAMEGSVR